jgi:hypothetical protein
MKWFQNFKLDLEPKLFNDKNLFFFRKGGNGTYVYLKHIIKGLNRINASLPYIKPGLKVINCKSLRAISLPLFPSVKERPGEQNTIFFKKDNMYR